MLCADDETKSRLRSVVPSKAPLAGFHADSSTVPSDAEVLPVTAIRLAVRDESA